MQIYPRNSNRSHFWQFIHETAIQVIIHTTGPYCCILQDPTRVRNSKTAAKCLKKTQTIDDNNAHDEYNFNEVLVAIILTIMTCIIH